jgi:hypothetical protein
MTAPEERLGDEAFAQIVLRAITMILKALQKRFGIVDKCRHCGRARD